MRLAKNDKKSSYFAIIFFLIILLKISNEKQDDKVAQENITISFDLSDPGISFEEDEKGEIIPIMNSTSKPQKAFKLPDTYLIKKDCRFQGWTADGIYGYEPGEYFFVQYDDVVFKPLFTEKNDTTSYKVVHIVELDGVAIENDISNFTKKKNTLVEMHPSIYSQPEVNHEGWQTEGHIFLTKDKMVMPDHDVIFTPVWHRLRYIIYSAGENIKGMIGNYESVLSSWEGTNYQLSDTSRLARKGYNLVGWHWTYNDQDYKFYDYILVGDEDIVLYAIWEPKNYKIGFDTGLSDIKTIKIEGKTDTVITVPGLPHGKEGYTFGGFKDKENGKIYMPGDSFYIEGQVSGGFTINSIWIKNNETTNVTPK